MPQQALDSMHIRARFQLMRGKGVAQRMNPAVLGDAGARFGAVVDALRALEQQ